MSRVILAVYMSIDGVIDVHENETWTFPYWNDELEAYQREPLYASHAMLLGRKTYEHFVSSWGTRTNEDDPFADRFNSMPKYVASTTLRETTWNARLLEGDVPEAVASLKQRPGRDLLVYGGGDLVATLIQHDLIDEYRLMVHPVVLGRGRRLFPDGLEKTLRLVDSQTTSTGVACLTLEPAGKDDEPSDD